MKKHPLTAFVLPLATAVCLCALTNGCALQTSSESESHMRQVKIGMTLYRQDDTFISTIQKNFEAIVKSREASEDVKIIVNILDGKGNQGVQNDQVDKFLSQGYDVICVNEVDRTAASVIIDKAKSVDIPVVFFNREPVEEDLLRWEKVYYVGSDAREAGQMQGQVVIEAYQSSPQTVDKNGDGKLQYVMLEGEQGHQDALIRTEYSVKEVTNAGIEVEKLGNETANWQRSQASAIASRWIEDFGDRIEVVFCNNDDMALGAIDAYTAADMDELPVIVGIDTTPPALEAIKDKTLTGSVLNDSKGQAEAIFNIAYALATGLNPKDSVPELDGRYVWIPQKIATFDHLPA